MNIDRAHEESQACFLRCIGEPTRLRIINLLAQGEKCVGDICRAIDRDQPLVSHHLHGLRECGIVSSRQERQKVYYRLRDDGLVALVNLTGDIVSRLAPCQPVAVKESFTRKRGVSA